MGFIEIHDQNNLDELSDHIDNEKKVFVLVYMNNCGPCNQTKPKWKQLENRMHEIENNENIVIAQLEMSLLQNQKKKINFGSINGFPHIVHIYKKNKKHIPISYENSEDIGQKDRSTDSFIRWIKKHGIDNNTNHKNKKSSIINNGFEGGGRRRKRRTKRQKQTRHSRQTRKNRRTKRR
jgi:hypothetical protein